MNKETAAATEEITATTEQETATTATSEREDEALEFLRNRGFALRPAEPTEASVDFKADFEAAPRMERTAYNRATLKRLLVCIGIAAMTIVSYKLNLIHPILAHPITLASLLYGSYRLGEWNGRRNKKER